MKETTQKTTTPAYQHNSLPPPPRPLTLIDHNLGCLVRIRLLMDRGPDNPGLVGIQFYYVNYCVANILKRLGLIN